MKKTAIFLMTVMILIAIFATTACAQRNSDTQEPSGGGQEVTRPDATQSSQYETGAFAPISYDFKAQYIRTNGYHDDVSYPVSMEIDSRAELDQYYVENAERYDFSHKDTVYSDTTIGFADAIQKYDDKWFETHRLIGVVLEEGSGSIRHKVAKVSRTAENEITVEMERYVPECGTDDMAEWHVLIEMDGDDLQSADQLRVLFAKNKKLEQLTQ